MPDRTLICVLERERKNKIKGGIYNKLQVDFAYNSNHIEGSRLSHDQTRYIFETQTVGIEPARVEDIIETVNHFRAFDLVIRDYDKPLDQPFLKALHKILKTGTLSADAPEAVVGDYKKYPNYVGDMETAKPGEVEHEIDRLLGWYQKRKPPVFDDLISFHAEFEKIHPFYDGNGRVGRLILFKECLKNNIVPFIISDEYKGYYYNGLKHWQNGTEKGFLRDTCLLMQDIMKVVLDRYEIEYSKEELS